MLIGDVGDDRLDGGPGRDRVFGSSQWPGGWEPSGADDDLLDLRDGESDAYGCGPGTDRVLADASDAFGYGVDPEPPLDCETVEVG